MSVQVEGETVEVVDMTGQLLEHLITSCFPPAAATPESNNPVKPPSCKQGRGSRVELGGVDVARVSQLLLFPTWNIFMYLYI